MAPGDGDKVGRGLGVAGVGQGVQVLTVPRREGRRGQLQVDGEEPVSGESPGSNIMANTEGSIYVGTWGWGHRVGHGWTQGGRGVDVG